MIALPAAALETLRAQALTAYPRECCGGLLGRIRGDHGHSAREVVRPVPLPNTWDERGQDRRYLIDSDAVRDLERQAEREGLELIGFFHSHPDSPARPSPYDQEHAWPWYTYVIVAVPAGVPGSVCAWRLADDRSAFSEEALTIVEDA